MSEIEQLIEARNRNLRWAAYYDRKADMLEQKINQLEGENDDR